MEKESRQRLKLLYLLKIFQEETDDEHSLTLARITEKLLEYGIKVNRKTLYSDINMLREFDVDIIMVHNGRERLYHMGEREFELPELKLLVDSVQASRFITEKKSKKLISKLERLTSTHGAKQLERQVYVAGRIKTDNESIYYNVDKIHSAIGKNVKIYFNYFQWSVDKVKILRHNAKIYMVSPWALTWDNDNYYLVGYDEDVKEIRHYRVDKMLNIELSSDKRTGQEEFKNFNIATYTNKLFGMFDGEEKCVTLKVNNELSGVIIDRFGTDVDIKKIDSEWFEVSVNVVVSDQFLSWIISLGENVIIKEPNDVVEKMRAIGERIVRMYG